MHMLADTVELVIGVDTQLRVRLNRSGDRQLNPALHLIVLTRLRYDPATRAYAQRRRAQGKTNREIKRCLVRYVARQLFRLLEREQAAGSWFDHPISNRDHASQQAGPRRLAAVF
jgi:transposase